MAARQGGSTLWYIVGAGVLGGGGYYMYQAGGSPKVAEKKMEADAAKLSSSVRGALPGKGEEIKQDSKVYAAEAGKQFDQAVDSAKKTTSQIDKKLENYRASAEAAIDQTTTDAKKNFTTAVDKFDNKVEKEAAKAKSWTSGWFGSK